MASTDKELTNNDLAKIMADIKEDFRKEINSLRTDVTPRLDKIDIQFNELSSGLKEMQVKLKNINNETVQLRAENMELRSKIEAFDNKLRRRNIIIHGLNVSGDRSKLRAELVTFFAEKLQMAVLEQHIEQCYTFHTSNSTTSPIFVSLFDMNLKDIIMRSWHKLKGTNIYINHDLTKPARDEQKILRIAARKAREAGCIARISGNKICVNGRMFCVDDVRNIDSWSTVGNYSNRKDSASSSDEDNSDRPPKRSGHDYSKTTAKGTRLVGNSITATNDGSDGSSGSGTAGPSRGRPRGSGKRDAPDSRAASAQQLSGAARSATTRGGVHGSKGTRGDLPPVSPVIKDRLRHQNLLQATDTETKTTH
jgi:regulator of replication initiation timing